MKIIAVNISKSFKNGVNPIKATERAWKLDLNKCKNFDYVIGVKKGKIVKDAFFILQDVYRDDTESDRVKFDLKTCLDTQEEKINNFISENKINLNNIITSYIE